MDALRNRIIALLFIIGAALVGMVVGLSIPQPGAGVIAALAVVAVVALGGAVLWRYRLWRR